MHSTFTSTARWAGALLVVLVLIATMVFVFLQSKSQPPELVLPENRTESGLYCAEGYTDIVAQALEAKNLEYCTCESDGYARELCEITITDALLYENAVAQLDERLCEEIVELTRKDACVQLITSSIETAPAEMVADTRLRNNDVRAIASYEKLHEEDESNIDTLLNLAKLNAEAGLREQEQGNDQVPYVEKALQYIEKAKVLEPESSAVYEAEGYVYEIMPDPGKAIDGYTKAIDIDAKNISAYVGRGHAENLVGMLDLALADFLKARSLDTTQSHPAVYAQLCRLQSTRTDLYADAKENCLILLDMPEIGALNKSEAYQTLAHIAGREGESDKVLPYYKKALLLTPKDANLLAALADYQIKQKDYESAAVYARESIAQASSKAVPHLSLAYALYQQEKFAEAVVEAERGLTLIDGDVSLLSSSKDAYRKEFYYTLANIYYYTGDKEQELTYKKLGDQLAI